MDPFRKQKYWLSSKRRKSNALFSKNV